ncbi:MAG: ABC transporter ATP-binding protein [Erythrobacter sp.]
MISALTIFGSIATLAVPWLGAQLLERVFGTQSFEFYQIAGLLVLALAAMALLSTLATIQSAKTAGRILAELRLDAYKHIQLLPTEFHERSRSGDLLALMSYEVSNLSDFLTSTLAKVPAMLLTAGGAIIFLFLIDPSLALFVPVLVPAFFILVKLLGRRLRGLGEKTREAEAKVMWVADEDLEILPAIKAFAVEEDRHETFRHAVEHSRELALQESRLTAPIEPAINLIAACAILLIIIVSGTQVIQGESTPSELFAFLLYAVLLTRPVSGLANVYGQFQIALGTINRLETVFAAPIEAGYLAASDAANVKGAIAFEGIGFGYPGRNQLLARVSFKINPGEIVALTGENGAGKSTLIRLLQRFYVPSEGSILLDGKDISEWQIQELRRQFGYVPQRALLFNGSIKDNIALGAPDAPEKQICEAAKLAQAWEFISELPNRLDTEIGDHGVQLSGGQRQRVALARALLNNPPMLIFDEATSMYDQEAETAFVDACAGALKGRTVIVVTHREASMALADRIFDVRDGKVEESAPIG